jgi:hypothetical protein
MLMAIVCKLSLHTNRWSDEFFLFSACCGRWRVYEGEEDEFCWCWGRKKVTATTSLVTTRKCERNCEVKLATIVAYPFSSAQLPLPSFLPLSFRPTEQ